MYEKTHDFLRAEDKKVYFLYEEIRDFFKMAWMYEETRDFFTKRTEKYEKTHDFLRTEMSEGMA